jgi:hypothetical protein
MEVHATFEEMRGAADNVVVGAFQQFSPGRYFQRDAEEDHFWYIDATFDVSEVIHGDWTAPRTNDIEFLSTATATTTGALAADIGALNDAVNGAEAVLFLREKDGDEAGLLRLVNSFGLVTTTTASQVDVPLADVPPHEESPEAADSLRDVENPRSHWSTLDEFIEDMRP